MERKHRIIAVVTAAMLALGLLGAAAFALATPFPARIELSTAQLDLGSIPDTLTVSQEVQVHNSGRGTLEINEASPAIRPSRGSRCASWLVWSDSR